MNRAPWLAAASLLSLCACNPQVPAAKPAPSSQPGKGGGPALRVSGQGTAAKPVRFVGQRKGNRVEYELLADSDEGSVRQGKARIIFRNARVTFHDKNGSTLSASAPQAILDQMANTVTLIDGVTAHNQSAMVLQCERLVYDHATEMLHGSGNVVISDPKGFRGTGSSFDSDISLTHYRMQ